MEGYELIPDSYWVEDYPNLTIDWPIEGILCPYITILSGQPKVGKTSFARLATKSIITGGSFLTRDIKLEKPKVGWMGFDSGWVGEIQKYTKEINSESLLLQNPMRSLDLKDWRELGKKLTDNGVGYFVVDHLYGIAGDLDLNSSHEAHRVMNCFQTLLEEYEIPSLLLAQATKNQRGGGQMAHSNLFKGSARVLLELSGTSRNGYRTLTINGNEVASESLKIILTPDNIELRSDSAKKEDGQVRDFAENLRKANVFLASATPEDLKTQATAGRWFAAVGYSVNDDSGRKMVKRFELKGLLELTPDGYVRGPNCFE